MQRQGSSRALRPSIRAYGKGGKQRLGRQLGDRVCVEGGNGETVARGRAGAEGEGILEQDKGQAGADVKGKQRQGNISETCVSVSRHGGEDVREEVRSARRSAPMQTARWWWRPSLKNCVCLPLQVRRVKTQW